MNALCRYNLCVLQKEAWLPGGAAPWAQLGFLERGNPVQPSQTCSTCSERWDLLLADASPLWGGIHTMLCGSVQTHTVGKQEQS